MHSGSEDMFYPETNSTEDVNFMHSFVFVSRKETSLKYTYLM